MTTTETGAVGARTTASCRSIPITTCGATARTEAAPHLSPRNRVATTSSVRTTAGLSVSLPTSILEDASRRCAQSHRRSEEHTSELQSQSNLVCRLLLEKKKKKKNIK